MKRLMESLQKKGHGVDNEEEKSDGGYFSDECEDGGSSDGEEEGDEKNAAGGGGGQNNPKSKIKSKPKPRNLLFDMESTKEKLALLTKEIEQKLTLEPLTEQVKEEVSVAYKEFLAAHVELANEKIVMLREVDGHQRHLIRMAKKYSTKMFDKFDHLEVSFFVKESVLYEFEKN